MTEELKACDYCGGTNFEVIVSFSYQFVRCKSEHCRADGPIRDTKEEAIAAWNTRAPLKVKLPDCGYGDDYDDGYRDALEDCADAIRAAGGEVVE